MDVHISNEIIRPPTELTVVINQSYKFVFVHVPKSAGTSVTNALSQLNRYCDLEIGGTAFGKEIQGPYSRKYGLGKHTTLARITDIIGEGDMEKLFKFSFVRNPFARALSTYQFLLRWGGSEPEFLSKIQSFGSFSEYVRSNIWSSTGGPDNIFRPQRFWLNKRGSGNKLGLDYVGYVENIRNDLVCIFRRIGAPEKIIETLEIKRFNASDYSKSLDNFMDPAVIDAIRAHYEIDFESFGYSLDPERAEF